MANYYLYTSRTPITKNWPQKRRRSEACDERAAVSPGKVMCWISDSEPNNHPWFRIHTHRMWNFAWTFLPAQPLRVGFWHRRYATIGLAYLVLEGNSSISKNKGSSITTFWSKLWTWPIFLLFHPGTSTIASVVTFVRPTTVASLSHWASTLVYNTTGVTPVSYTHLTLPTIYSV